MSEKGYLISGTLPRRCYGEDGGSFGSASRPGRARLRRTHLRAERGEPGELNLPVARLAAELRSARASFVGSIGSTESRPTPRGRHGRPERPSFDSPGRSPEWAFP